MKLKLNITAGIQVNTMFSDCALMVSEIGDNHAEFH